MSYEGLLEEFIGFNYGYIPVDNQHLEGKPENNGKKFDQKFEPTVFKDYRDVNIKAISKRLMKEMLDTREVIKAIKGKGGTPSIEELKIMTELNKRAQHITMHLNISFELLTHMKSQKYRDRLIMEQDCLDGQEMESIIDTICAWTLSKENREDIFRMLCVLSIINNGIEEKYYDMVKKEVIESFGYEHTIVFNALDKCGLLKKKDKKKKDDKSTFQKLKQPLGLVREFPENVDVSLINLPYDAYVPLSYKQFELAISDAWKHEAMKIIPGEIEVQGVPDYVLASKSTRKCILVYMIGGMTYAEASYMRKLAESLNVEILMATTNMISYKDILKPFLDLIE